MDSTYAPAFAALGSTLLLLGDMPGVVDVDMAVAEDAAARALELDEGSPEALAVITATAPDPRAPPSPPTTASEPTGRVRRAREIQLRASSDALDSERREAWVVHLTGMGGEAVLPIIRKAMAMGRVPESRQIEVAHVLVAAGHPHEAIDLLEDVVDEWPNAAGAWSALELAHASLGDFDEAVEVRMARIVELEERDPAVADTLERAFEDGGEYGYWEWSRVDFEERLKEGHPVEPAGLATTYAALGESELALEWLRRAVDQGDPGLLAIRTDPVWDTFRDDPEFRAIAREIRGRPGSPSRGPRGPPPGR
jgi:tetratricopeptide (TPR) repeat protein